MSFRSKRRALRLRMRVGDDLECTARVKKTTRGLQRMAARHAKFARVIGRCHHERLEPN